MKDFLSRKFKFPNTALSITFVALFTSLAIVLNALYLPITNTLKLSFQYIPISLAAIITGPIGGGLVGALADVIGFFLNADGPFTPLFTISGFLEGFIMGLFLYNSKRRTPISVILSRVTVNIFVYFILNSIWLKLLYGKAIIPMLPARGIKAVVGIVVESLIIIALIPLFNNATKQFGMNISFSKNKSKESDEKSLEKEE
jgi:ECF transporter S component (folate family)